jgi:hypothetical protein
MQDHKSHVLIMVGVAWIPTKPNVKDVLPSTAEIWKVPASRVCSAPRRPPPILESHTSVLGFMSSTSSLS